MGDVDAPTRQECLEGSRRTCRHPQTGNGRLAHMADRPLSRPYPRDAATGHARETRRGRASTPGEEGLGTRRPTCQGRRKRGESMTIRSAQTTIRMSMMNVVHDLSVLVARDEGLFREEG